MEKTRLGRLEMVLLSCKARKFVKDEGRSKFQLFYLVITEFAYH